VQEFGADFLDVARQLNSSHFWDPPLLIIDGSCLFFGGVYTVSFLVLSCDPVKGQDRLHGIHCHKRPVGNPEPLLSSVVFLPCNAIEEARARDPSFNEQFTRIFFTAV